MSTSDPRAARFWSKVHRTLDESCWLWLAGVDADGYGRFRDAGRPRMAHVVAWELEHGPVPAGQRVHHVSWCRQPRSCVRPAHLTLGSQASAIRARDARSAPAGAAPRAARPGRPAAGFDVERAAQLRAAGASVRAIAAKLGASKSAVDRALSRNSGQSGKGLSKDQGGKAGKNGPHRALAGSPKPRNPRTS